MVKESSTIQVKVRMSRAFHRELMRQAQRNDRTLNAEILARLGAVHKSDTLPEKAQIDWDKVQKQWRDVAAKAYSRAIQHFEERLTRLEEGKEAKTDDQQTRIR
jgi:hypothetical protein